MSVRTPHTRRGVLVYVAPLLVALTAAALGAPGRAGAQEAPPPARPTPASWTADGADLSQGDVVTILIDEYTLATVNVDELEAQGHIRDVGASGGTVSTRMGGAFRTRNDVEDTRFGESARRDRFQAEITARVVEVQGSLVRLEGTKSLTLDDHEQAVTIRGWARSEDIGMANTVESWRLADAEISYTSNGKLGRTGGIWSKILGILLP